MSDDDFMLDDGDFDEPFEVMEEVDDDDDFMPETKKKKAPAKKKETKKKETKKKETKKKETKKKKASKSAKPKKKKISDSEAVEKIRDYIIPRNRPYSVPLLLVSLHGEVGKAQMLRALDTLVKSNELTEQAFGRTKLYYRSQDGLEEIDSEQLKALDNEMKEQKDRITELSTKNSKLKSTIKSYKSALTNEEIENRIKELTEQNETLEEKISICKEKSKDINTDQIVKLEKEFESTRKEWRKRKRTFKEIIGKVTESGEITYKSLKEELGFEEDEDYEADINESRVMKRRKLNKENNNE
eukprot:TRINITY_DN1565_c0_g1_i5.p2 TRINITY_DN1565_c0_g1~~TRINITY_DN1565_c0_g1_i5.p2  ORF type:complete len:300 (+),score=108.61 TRINITY_DN1565_c0_g1_i5:95-994(+)